MTTVYHLTYKPNKSKKVTIATWTTDRTDLCDANAAEKFHQNGFGTLYPYGIETHQRVITQKIWKGYTDNCRNFTDAPEPVRKLTETERLECMEYGLDPAKRAEYLTEREAAMHAATQEAKQAMKQARETVRQMLECQQTATESPTTHAGEETDPIPAWIDAETSQPYMVDTGESLPQYCLFAPATDTQLSLF